MTAGVELVPALGTRRRLRALVALGWPPAVLRERSGLAVEALIHTGRHTRVAPDIARRAVALFERLSMTPGPDPAWRDTARRLRWFPPLAWDDDDLDDPAARGSLGTTLPCLGPDPVAVRRVLDQDPPKYLHLIDREAALPLLGAYTAREAAELLRVETRSVERQRAALRKRLRYRRMAGAA